MIFIFTILFNFLFATYDFSSQPILFNNSDYSPKVYFSIPKLIHKIDLTKKDDCVLNAINQLKQSKYRKISSKKRYILNLNCNGSKSILYFFRNRFIKISNKNIDNSSKLTYSLRAPPSIFLL